MHLASSAQVNNNVRLLLDATRNASGMTQAVNKVTEDIMRYDYAQTLLGTQEVQGLRETATAVMAAAKDTTKMLEILYQNMGLSSIALPEPGSLSDNDHKFLQHLVHLQTLRQILWVNVQSYQDEALPITDSSSRGGSTRRQGTTKLASTTDALKSKAKQVTLTVNKFNSVLQQMMNLHRPRFISEGLIPGVLKVSELLYLKPEDPLWDEVLVVCNG